jgi:hypothetical protein
LAGNIFGEKYFWQKMFLAGNIFGEKYFGGKYFVG